jgi:hypothetical protein
MLKVNINIKIMHAQRLYVDSCLQYVFGRISYSQSNADVLSAIINTCVPNLSPKQYNRRGQRGQKGH